MLTRQLDGPDLDGLVSEAAFFFGLEMYHLPLLAGGRMLRNGGVLA